MAYTTINKPNLHFNTVTYSGTGSNQTITTGFKPDFVWTKRRNGAYSNELQDAVRGVTKVNYTDGLGAEDTVSQNIQSFNSTDYVQGSNPGVNASGGTYVSWNWSASGTTPVSNTSGTISSSVSTNSTSGFSIISYTGNGTSGATVGHGLGVTPACYFMKCRSNSGTNWSMYHQSLGNTKAMVFTATAPRTSAAYWNNTSPTSTVFSLGNDQDVNSSGFTYIAYCFAEKKGFNKFGSYTGNASTDGPFVYTGFKPAFVLLKDTSSATSQSYPIFDNKRNTYNPESLYLYVNTNVVEGTETGGIDFLSNGFKIRNSFDYTNTSGATYIYMAFAEQPLVGTNDVPATAR
jgi:hypothetical protein